MESLRTPTADRLTGSWYLAAGTAGFLDVRPKVETVEVFVSWLAGEKIRLSTVCEADGRIFRLSQKMRVSSARGTLTFNLFPGSAAIMRRWRIGETRGGEVLRVTHEGSMLFRGGSLFYVHSGVEPADARRLIEQSRRDLNLSKRDMGNMVWRRRPTITLTGDPEWTLRERLSSSVRDDTRPDATGRRSRLLG